MTVSHILLFIHILGAIAWLGASITLELLGWRASQSGKRSLMEDHIHMTEWLAPRIFMPAALTTLIAGILLVATGRPEFGQLWVVLALIGIVITAALGGGVMGKLAKQIEGLFKKAGKDNEIERLYSRLTFFAHINLSLLFIILFDMVIKPKASDIGFFVVSGVFFIVVFLYSYSHLRKA